MTDIAEQSSPVIVVGVDGSKPGAMALRWAAEQARLTGASIHAVHAWNYPMGVGPAQFEAWTTIDFAGEAEAAVERTITEVLAGSTDVPVTRTVVEGNPVQVLLAAADNDHASLIVVGNRGRGGFKSLLLGSVSEQCATHASCPVVVVRGTS